MSAFKDLTKREFGRLTAIERVENDKYGHARWECRCDCGNIVVIRGDALRPGGTESCGCLVGETAKKVNTKHGMSKTTEYTAWEHMIQRCNNPDCKAYQNYGGRGITICGKWLAFDGFFEDMGFKPKGLTLERRDNMSGYCKENCCWATPTEQARNKRVQKNNTTGVVGVWWNKAARKYQAMINIGKNKRLFLGYFVDLEEAAEVRRKAEQRYWKAA